MLAVPPGAGPLSRATWPDGDEFVSASGALLPARISSSPCRPYLGSTNDGVATAPTLGSATSSAAESASGPTLQQPMC